MTTITIEVPDELAAKLAPVRQELPALIAQALERHATTAQSDRTKLNANHPTFIETLDFLTSSPTPEQIIAFKASPAVQERLEELLDNNREDELTEEEKAELDAYEQINDLMILLKAHARTTQSQTN
ncbi:MAG TPA: hypothetical protein VFC63_26030 [Blastocatellia bacterium]|nr:hypothetical protein [Blastocatellia bacterium]